MEIVLLPSSAGPDTGYQFLATVVVDGVLALDAGCLGLWGDLAGQAKVRDVVLTHSHMDHVGSLPVFLENVYAAKAPVTVHGLAETLAAVRSDVFNERLFPDLITREPEAGPFAIFDALAPGRTRELAEHAVTLVPVNHPVPTAAVHVDGGDSSLLYVTDTRPTEAVWEYAARVKNLKAVLLEATFPDEFAWLAEISVHLTPKLFAAEVRKIPPGVPVFVVHLKPRFRDAVLKELAALALPGVQVMTPGKRYGVG